MCSYSFLQLFLVFDALGSLCVDLAWGKFSAFFWGKRCIIEEQLLLVSKMCSWRDMR